MNLQKILKSMMTVSLLIGAVAQANPRGPGRGPGAPGPVRPGPDNNDCRGGRMDPRCDDRRGDHRDDRRGDHRDDRRDDRRGDRRDDRRDDRWGRDDRRYPPPRHNPPPRYNPPPRHNPQPPYTPPPVYNPPPSRGESSIIFSSVTRRMGGEWLRVNVHYPIRIDYVQVQVLGAPVQIHEAALVTRNGLRYNIRNLSRTGMIHSVLSSEFLSINDQIIAIDLRTEAMGGYADLRVNVIGSGQTPLSGNRF